MAGRSPSGEGVVIGVLGGGQLGRMMALDAARLGGLKIVCLDPAGADAAACGAADEVIKGGFMDMEAVLKVPGDVVTVEIEHVNVEALEQIERDQGRPVHPAPETLRIIADKALQKDHMVAHRVPVVDYAMVAADAAAIVDVAETQLGGFPVMLKSRKLAYDGRGNAVVRSAGDAAAALKSLGGTASSGGVYLERWAPFQAELACIVARDREGRTALYDVVETRQADNICRVVVAPPSFGLPEEARAEAMRVATRAVGTVKGAGVFAVEMFWMGGATVLYNEMAPRPHNSGHLTIEACVTSQFEQHVRCVAGLPLGDTSMRVGAAAMINILGAPTEAETLDALRPALKVPGAKVHWYNKACRPGRKLGHITVTAPDMPTLRQRLVTLGEPLDEEDKAAAAAATAAAAAAAAAAGGAPGGAPGGALAPPPLVGIIMGSDSDLPTMQPCARVLEDLGVPFELTVVSAHRTPDRMYAYAKAAKQRGLRVIVAGAGGAAHLPGMVAALTPLPVVGVPVKTSTLNGQDSLLSIVQMPGGVPVATVAIGNAKNAGLLAVRMIACAPGPEAALLAARLDAFHAAQTGEVLDKAGHLEVVHHERYLAEYRHADRTHLYLPRIRACLAQGRVLTETALDLAPRGAAEAETVYYKGKVRDRYDDGAKVVLVTSDRLTAFDRAIAVIPFKGQVLNLVSLWWFQQTRHIVANQLHAANAGGPASAVHPNVTVARRCKPFPIEFVMRGFLTGSSGTSVWTHYSKGVRDYCGHSLPDGMKKNEAFATNLCTPTTKSDEHDELIDAATIVSDGWMTQADWDFCKDKAAELFAFGQKVASQHGLMLVDTKYEFGKDLETGEILLIDEIHTPDCSRYWVADSYEKCLEAGAEPENIDKEFVRIWYTKRCDPYKDAELPEAPVDLVVELSRRYLMLYERITGEKFPFSKPEPDVNAAIQAALDQKNLS